MATVETQLNEWQEKLNFYLEQEAQIVDLEQKYNAGKKIKEAEAKVNELKALLDSNKPEVSSFVQENSEIKTLHQALDLFIQQKEKLNHKTSKEEFEELEKIQEELFDRIFGEFKDKIVSTPVLKNKAIISLFERIITSEKFSTSIINEITDVRKDIDNYQFYDRSVIISAITLSILSWKVFDNKKLDLLIDFLTDFETSVWEKALTGIILSTIVHQNRLQRYPYLIKRLQTLQDLENVQIGIFLIDNILRNQLFKSVEFPDVLNQDDFLTETPYNWFYPFYENNNLLKDALDKTHQDFDFDEFMQHIYSIPLLGAFKYALCNQLRDNKVMFVKKKTVVENGKDDERLKKLYMAFKLSPYFNLIAEFYLYYKHFPKDRIINLFESKITLAETKLKNIILSKTQALKLAADLHFEKKEYNACINKLKDLLNIEPNQMSALRQISICYIEKEEHSEALIYLLQVEKLNKTNISNLYDIAYCLSYTDQNKKSNEYVLKLYELYPEEENFLALIGSNYYDLKEYQLAIDFYLKAINVNQNNEAAIYGTRNSYSKLNLPEMAIEYSLKLCDLKPKDPDFAMALATDYAELGEFIKSVELAEKAFLLNMENPEIVFEYGRVLFISKAFEKAELIFNKVFGLKKSQEFYGITYGNLGHIYLFQRKIDSAIECYRKCVLEFDDIKEFAEKFDVDLKYALDTGISSEEYNGIKTDLIAYWQANK